MNTNTNPRSFFIRIKQMSFIISLYFLGGAIISTYITLSKAELEQSCPRRESHEVQLHIWESFWNTKVDDHNLPNRRNNFGTFTTDQTPNPVPSSSESERCLHLHAGLSSFVSFFHDPLDGGVGHCHNEGLVFLLLGGERSPEVPECDSLIFAYGGPRAQ